MGSAGKFTEWLLLALLFGVALGIRVYGITGPPLEFHPTKQYRSAITARAYYYEQAESVTERQREVARDNLQRIGVIVPTPQERAIAWLYVATGGERIWIGRLFSVLCWLAGGMWLYALARRTAGFESAFLATSFYLLLPFGVVASMSFQPDPPMVAAVVGSVLASVRFHERPDPGRFAAAAGVAAVAVFLKPISLFLVLPAFVGSALGYRRKLPRAVELLGFALLAVLPSVGFYLYRILVEHYAEWEREASFLPAYTLRFEFWDGWLKRVRLSLGVTYFVAGLVGAMLAARWAARSLLLALWSGYFVMCFAVSYKISTHDYYHLPLVPVVALGLAQLIVPLVERLDTGSFPQRWKLAVWAVVLVGLFVAAGTSVQARRRVPDYTAEIAVARDVGRLVGHSTRTIFLAPDYGHPLMYYGELSGRDWPYGYDIRDEALYTTSPRSAAERLARMTEAEAADFFVVLDRDELSRQPDLAMVLRERFPVFAEGERFIIFDMRTTEAM